GSGTADYFSVNVNMGTTTADYVDWQATALPATDELTLTKGTFKYNVNAAYTPFTTPLIAAGTGFWTANGTVTNTGATYTVGGHLRAPGGTMNTGNGNDEALLLGTGSSFVMDGGAINVAARLVRETAGTAHSFDMSAGTITIGANNNTVNIGSFQLESTATFK